MFKGFNVAFLSWLGKELQVSHSWKAFGVSVLDGCGCTGAARPFGFSRSSWSSVWQVPHVPEEGDNDDGWPDALLGRRTGTVT